MNGRKCRNETRHTNTIYSKTRNDDETKTKRRRRRRFQKTTHEIMKWRTNEGYEDTLRTTCYYRIVVRTDEWFCFCQFFSKCCSCLLLGGDCERKCGASETMTITKNMKQRNNEYNWKPVSDLYLYPFLCVSHSSFILRSRIITAQRLQNDLAALVTLLCVVAVVLATSTASPIQLYGWSQMWPWNRITCRRWQCGHIEIIRKTIRIPNVTPFAGQRRWCGRDVMHRTGYERCIFAQMHGRFNSRSSGRILAALSAALQAKRYAEWFWCCRWQRCRLHRSCGAFWWRRWRSFCTAKKQQRWWLWWRQKRRIRMVAIVRWHSDLGHALLWVLLRMMAMSWTWRRYKTRRTANGRQRCDVLWFGFATQLNAVL